MAQVLNLRQAARLAGVSPNRLYRVLKDGRLSAAPGGGPGKPTLGSLEAVQTFCRSEGLRVPDAVEMLERSERDKRSDRAEHAERSIDAEQDLDTLVPCLISS